MTLTEYWPTFVERSDAPRTERIAFAEAALSCPWVIEKARKLGETPVIKADHYVVAGKWVIALITA